MSANKKIKLTKRQKEIIQKVRDGWVIIVGRSEDNGRIYQLVTKGYEDDRFNAQVWGALTKHELIDQQTSPPFNWELTPLGKTIEL